MSLGFPDPRPQGAKGPGSGAGEIRTRGLVHAKDAIFQLIYRPNAWRPGRPQTVPKRTGVAFTAERFRVGLAQPPWLWAAGQAAD